MPKFITIGYGDQAGYDRTQAVRDAAHAQDAKLVSEGALMLMGSPAPRCGCAIRMPRVWKRGTAPSSRPAC